MVEKMESRGSRGRSSRGPKGRSSRSGRGGGGGGGGGGNRSGNHDNDGPVSKMPDDFVPTGDPQVLNLFDLQKQSVPELNLVAEGFGLIELGALRKHELIFEILKANATLNGEMFSQGVVEILPDGFGFLRSPYNNYLPSPEDIYVSPSQI